MTSVRTLPAHVVQGFDKGPHLLIVGGVHGDEFEPMAAIRRLKHQIDPATLRGKVTLIPCVNEAAFLRGHRTAEDGLDLARVCPGKADGSLTEQVAALLSQYIESADLFVDLHTGGTTLSVYPLAGYTMHSNPTVLDAQRRMARAFNLPVVWGTSAELDGRTLSVARDADIPAIYAEYLGGANCSPEGIAAYVDGCFNLMSEFGMLSRIAPVSRVKYIVEDPRPQSGHLQIQNLSPITGFFEPALKLGDPIRQGDPIGTVYDLAGDESTTIHSQQTGILLVTKTFSRVLAGESVGVVLELSRT